MTAPQAQDDRRLLHPKEAANLLGVKPRTLQDWAQRQIGPPYVLVSERVRRYTYEDLQKFIDDKRVETTT